MRKSILLLTFVLFAFITVQAQDSVNVTFNVDMSVKTLEGFFNPASDVVTVPGAHNNWLNEPPANSEKTMSDADGDTIYTRLYRVATNTTYEYKYNIGLGWDGKDEGSNRSVEVGTTDIILDPVYFNNDSVVTITANGNILFRVDMSVMAEIGIYDPTVDSMRVYGSFNGWSGNDPLRSYMNQDAIDPNKWFLDVPFTNHPLQAAEGYKYFNDIEDTNSTWVDGWERPSTQGGGNRDVTFLGQPSQEVPEVYYDDIHPDWVVPVGTSAVMNFRVDMAPAMDPGLQPIPFDPATDTVFWICEQPSFAESQGWVDENTMRVLPFTLESGTIYTASLTIQPPGFNSFVYRYAFTHVADTSWQFEPEGFGDNAYRVRYIHQTGPRTFQSPWDAPTDIWTNAENKGVNEGDPFTAVRDEEIIASTYSLGQNYPNPFNPSTKIKFSIPEAGLVTIRVFDLLGQEVAVLVNEELTAGSYTTQFDALRYSSGIYFYTINAGDFNATRKMILMK